MATKANPCGRHLKDEKEVQQTVVMSRMQGQSQEVVHVIESPYLYGDANRLRGANG